ncbi:MAG: hypothetical protein WCE56_05240 [Desulfobacterales bacterium]
MSKRLLRGMRQSKVFQTILQAPLQKGLSNGWVHDRIQLSFFRWVEMVNEFPEPRRVEDDDVGQKNGRQRKYKNQQVQQQDCGGQEDAVGQAHRGPLQSKIRRKLSPVFRIFSIFAIQLRFKISRCPGISHNVFNAVSSPNGDNRFPVCIKTFRAVEFFDNRLMLMRRFSKIKTG